MIFRTKLVTTIDTDLFNLLQALDDGVLTGKWYAVINAMHLIEDLGPYEGLFINLSKCEVFSLQETICAPKP